MKRIKVIFKLGKMQTQRVVRGGVWNYFPVNMRVTFRYRYQSDDRLNFASFRLVQER